MSNSESGVARSIKRLRLKEDLTQKELSLKCGYSRTYVGKIERGEKSPSLNTLLRIADALEVSPVRLFTDYETPPGESGQIPDTPSVEVNHPDPSIFDRFHYLIGTASPNGRVRTLRTVPLMKQLFNPNREAEKYLWNLDFLSLDSNVRERLKEAVREAENGESGYYQLKPSDNNGEGWTLDFSIHPLREREGQVEELAFELFWPKDSELKAEPTIDTINSVSA